MQANKAEWTIAYWHHPPYTKGSHDSDREIRHIEIRENVLPMIEKYGVDLILGGHSHTYERSKLIDGHYGYSESYDDALYAVDAGQGDPESGGYKKEAGPNNGAVYVVAGSSGKIGLGSLDHPAMIESLMELGSLVLDIEGDTLKAAFLTPFGKFRDAFQITKIRED